MDFEATTIPEWLEPLKKYQSSAMTQLIEQHGPEMAAKIWLSAQGPRATASFGGGANSTSTPFFDKFYAEFKKFICGDPCYDTIRSQLHTESPIASGIAISIISSAIGSTLGFAAALLAPSVAALLYLVAKMGVNAWCSIE
ncbi:hypothetical protein LZ620_18795 [Aeromonas salmonicida]|nr:hypothetical protein [Aeromonas salmonicida]